MGARKDCSHFIPLQTQDLVDLVCSVAAVPADDREALRQLACLIQQAHHAHYHQRLVELKREYAPFDPDSDNLALGHLPAEEKQRRLNDLLGDLNWLLDRGHFRHLGRQELEPALAEASDWGIRMTVDFSQFEHVAIFVRGESFQKRLLRSWRTWFQEEEIELPIFRRLVLMLKFRPNPALSPGVSSEQVYLKIFKDIPRADVDMLLPGARVRLKLLDRSKIGFGLISGMATMAYRMFNDLLQFVQYLVLSDTALWGLTAGCLGYGYKSYYDYQTTRQAYHLNLTQSLYFQNLDSNAGVLTRLLDEAEEQETRTSFLAYFCMWKYAGPDGFTAEELESSIEFYLDRYTDTTLLCEPGEPAGKLVHLGLAQSQNNRYRALPPAEALCLLGHKPAPVEPRTALRQSKEPV